MESEKLTPELGGRLRRTAVLVATFTATQANTSYSQHQKAIAAQIHLVARSRPGPRLLTLVYPS